MSAATGWYAALNSWFSSLRPDGVTLPLLALISLIFLASLAFLTIPLAVRQWQVRNMRKALERNGSVGDLSPNDKEQLESRLKKSKWRRAVWTPFLHAWNELYDPSINCAAQPVDFLRFCTPERVIPGIADRRLASVVPGVLVALGIFGTFLGLTLGLPEASAVQGDQASTAIEKLISGLKIAFQTSLLGIFTSIVFLVSDRLAFHGLERSVRRLADAVYSFYPAVAAEVLLRDEARERAEATKQLKTLATDIAVALENSMGSIMRDALGDAMEAKLAPVLTELQDVVSKLSTTVSSDMVGALQSFSDRINDNLSGAFRDSFADLTENLKGVVATQDQMRELLSTSAERMQQQADIQQRLTDEVIAAAASLEGLLGSLAQITERLHAASEGVGAAITQLSESSEEATKAQHAIGQAQRELSEQVRQDLDRLQEARSSILQGWNAVSAEARDSIVIVQEAVRQLGTAVGDNLLTALGRFDEKLADVTDRFSGTLHEARETINELPDLLTKMSGSSQAMSDATTALQGEIHSLLESLQTSVGDSTERASVAAERLADVTVQAAKVASQFGATIDRASVSAEAQAPESIEVLDQVTDGLAGLQKVVGLIEKMSMSTAEIERSITGAGHVDMEGVIERLDRLNEVRGQIETIREHAEKITESMGDGTSGGVLRGLFGRRR